MSVRAFMLVLLATLPAIAGCGEDSTTSAEPPIAVDVFFNLSVDGAPIQLSTSAQTYTNPAGTKYGIKELRFIISDVKLHDDAGGSAKLKDVHYFDIRDAATQSIHADGLPHANYVSVSFTFGLGADLGYHYMQLEGNYEQTPGGATGGYTTHTGPRHLDGTNPSFPGIVDATAHHFSFPVSASFTPTHIHEGGLGELAISFDLNDWYLDHTPGDGVDTGYDFTALPGQMIMGNLDAQGRLQANGPGCFSATLTAAGGHDH